MKGKKNDFSEYCRGCLTKDRRLVPIDNLFPLFIKIMDGVPNPEDLTNVPIMCWECRAILRNTKEFAEKAKTAYEILTEKNKKIVQAKSLSNLTTIVSNHNIQLNVFHGFETEIDIKHDAYIPQTDTQSDAQLDVDFKEECLSQDEKIDTDFYEDVKEESLDTEFVIEETDVVVKNEEVKPTGSKDSKNGKEKSKESKNSKNKLMRSQYKLIYLDKKDSDSTPSFTKVPIDDNERIFWREQDKTARNYSLMPYKCESCITGYAKPKYYNKHVTNFHLKTAGKYVCDICGKRSRTKMILATHMRSHYIKYVCRWCPYENHREWKMHAHLSYAHKRAVMCLTCQMKFERLIDFRKHYNNLHAHVICDYCGKKWNSKQRLIKHISLRHYPHRCDVCKRNYSSIETLTHHRKMYHVVSRTEECYCVECNIQFDNIYRYNSHLKSSVKHKKFVGVPCPECDKVYHKKTNMTNHYKYVHLKQTPHYCEKCSRYFLNGYRLRLHQARTHDKILPDKKKVCPHCGRAFSTNRILDNHIRTHTGERPFVCEVCLAKFAQKTALVVHKRSIHKLSLK